MTMSAIPESGSSRSALPSLSAASVIGAALETMRPYQWLKNLLVFIPLAAAHRLSDFQPLGAATRVFVAFSLCASSIYVFNDLHDAPADRLHPHKRYRPIASWALPRSMAIGLVAVLLFFSLALVKRYAELTLLSACDGAAARARAYRLEDREVILALGGGSGIVSALVLTQYLGSSSVELLYSRSEFIGATFVLLLYWVCYVWLTAHRGRMPDDPLVFAIKDRVSQILVVLMGVAAWLAV